jgi:3-oxoacyl-[acyl-carrier protein] reductase
MLFNKVVWITGASRGIGAAIAVKCNQAGATLALSSRNVSALERFHRENFDAHHRVLTLSCDVRNEVSVDAAYMGIIEEFGRVDVLINNAGTGTWKNSWEMSSLEFDETIETNLRGNFLLMKAVIPRMIERGEGRIVNILSVASVKPFTQGAAYGSSKAGAYMLSRIVREEVREFGIKVIDVLPGATETEIWDDESRRLHSGRMMQPEDIASAVCSVLQFSDRVMPEEIVLRPQLGDL